jgi:ABC-2 type transport system ATP-binding protein
LAGRTVFHLSGSDALVTSGAQTGSADIFNPPGGTPSSYTETPNFTGPDSSPRNTQPPMDQPGQFASFTSQPFAQAVTSVGVPELRVTLSHQAPDDLVVFAKVWDVDAQGNATLIHRLAAPARIPSSQLGSPVTIKLLGFAHRFAAGHSVRLTLTTTDQYYYNNPSPDMITIATGPDTSFILPSS